uniref:Purple acid phosphatase C-terminal domain-containing protein n=1 Tax=Aegilops tauschii subsp. strangulata TaxID=200361 RepID=A0A453BXQ0_AEGTS
AARSFQKNHKLARLSLMREASFGHGRLSVVNATAARWAWHRNDDADSTVRDELWLESLAANGSCRRTQPFADYWSDEL